jgi:hypothetical protein
MHVPDIPLPELTLCRSSSIFLQSPPICKKEQERKKAGDG